MADLTIEGKCSPGDIIETSNGNRYLILDLEGKGRVQFYVGNADPERIPKDEMLEVRPNGPCEVVGRAEFNAVH